MPTFATACFDHGSTASCSHASSEAMFFGSFPCIGLKSSLQGASLGLLKLKMVTFDPLPSRQGRPTSISRQELFPSQDATIEHRNSNRNPEQPSLAMRAVAFLPSPLHHGRLPLLAVLATPVHTPHNPVKLHRRALSSCSHHHTR